MDIKLKRGFIEICALKVLSTEDTYGYQLIKKLSSVIQISESTLYPVLKRLEGAELLSTYSVEHNGRLRKYYQITGAGRERIALFLQEWQEVMKLYTFIKEDAPHE